jgi:uncharacterized protein (DUF1015 family)
VSRVSEIRPFAALRYARDPEPRIAPPYDVLSDADRERFAAEPENVVHLTLPPGPEGERDYAAARARLARWLAAGVLVRDAEPALYVLRERTPRERLRHGFFGLLRLADYAERVVLPHERTMPGPKRDRLLLTRAVEANLEPLFFLYEDREGALARDLEAAARGAPLASARGPDGTGLELRAVAEAGAIARAAKFLDARPLVIGDGHHRYETMLAYRDERRLLARTASPEAPYEWVLGYFVNAFDPGTEIRAIHRALRDLSADPARVLRERGFRVEELPEARDPDALVARLAPRQKDAHAFAFVAAGRPALLAERPRGEPLDVEVLHAELLPALGGTLAFDAEPARALERAGPSGCAVLLNPVAPDDLFRVVSSGAVLPQKSTFFTPKVPSGLVLRDFLAGAKL